MYLQPKFIPVNVLNILITERVKLINADWSMKRVFFLNFACEGAKLLAHDWSSVCLATAYAIE